MIVLCQWCQVKDTDRKEMNVEIIEQKKIVRRYYHKHCWDKYLEHKEFIAEEMEKKDKLNATLLEIYGVKEMPNQAWTLLEKLRGGNPVFGKNQKNITKRYRQGYDYILIKETFEYCSDTIEYWNGRKNFDGLLSAFKYALSIIIDKIYVVEQRAEHRKKQQMMTEKHLEKVNVEEEFVSSYKKKEKSKSDITDFLDD